MRLNIFNKWNNLGRIYGKDLEYHTSRMKDKDLFITYIRDKDTKNVVTRYYGQTKDSSLKATIDFLKKIGAEATWEAIESGEPITRLPDTKPERKVDWRDGVNHRYRAQKRIVGEKVEDKKKPPFNNIVAKHAHKFNRSVAFKDKKNDYKRNPKHKKNLETLD